MKVATPAVQTGTQKSYGSFLASNVCGATQRGGIPAAGFFFWVNKLQDFLGNFLCIPTVYQTSKISQQPGQHSQ